MHGGKQLGEGVLRSRRRHLDVAILEVADPSGKAQFPRALPHEPAEADALDSTRDLQMNDCHAGGGSLAIAARDAP